jgi:hypothetical protein
MPVPVSAPQASSERFNDPIEPLNDQTVEQVPPSLPQDTSELYTTTLDITLNQTVLI